jgi:hypothetical protein
MKRLLGAVVLGIAAFAASTSWSDNMPSPGSETTPKDPFALYDIGPGPDAKTPKPFWSYDDLSPAEKAVAEKSKNDAKNWPAIHDAYNTAVAEQAQRAAATSAASQLGVNDLALTGVVP